MRPVASRKNYNIKNAAVATDTCDCVQYYKIWWLKQASTLFQNMKLDLLDCVSVMLAVAVLHLPLRAKDLQMEGTAREQ